MERIESNRQTRLFNSNTRSSLSIHGKLPRTRAIEPYRDPKNNNYKQRHRHNKYFHTIKRICLLLATTVIATPAYAADVGGVSATANPIGTGVDVTTGVVADMPAYGNTLTMSGGVAGNLAGTITSAGVTTLTAGGAGTTATGQFVTEIVIE